MTKKKITTYKEVMERLKDVPLDQYTSQDIFDRYIAYGTVAELNDPTIQELIIKNGYTEYLVNTLGEMTTNESIIKQMLNSECFKKNYTIKRGTIADIQIVKNKDLPSSFVCANITLLDTTNERYQIEYVDEEERINTQFIKSYVSKYITVVVQKMDNINRLCCFLTIK